MLRRGSASSSGVTPEIVKRAGPGMICMTPMAPEGLRPRLKSEDTLAVPAPGPAARPPLGLDHHEALDAIALALGPLLLEGADRGTLRGRLGQAGAEHRGQAERGQERGSQKSSAPHHGKKLLQSGEPALVQCGKRSHRRRRGGRARRSPAPAERRARSPGWRGRSTADGSRAPAPHRESRPGAARRASADARPHAAWTARSAAWATRAAIPAVSPGKGGTESEIIASTKIEKNAMASASAISVIPVSGASSCASRGAGVESRHRPVSAHARWSARASGYPWQCGEEGGNRGGRVRAKEAG
jgi:hypothetical protein